MDQIKYYGVIMEYTLKAIELFLLPARGEDALGQMRGDIN